MPPPPTDTDNFKQFQELFKWVTDGLEIPLEQVLEEQYKLLDIQQTLTSKIALPINDALMKPATIVWQTLAIILPICKRDDKKYYVPSKGMDFLFSHPAPNFLIVDAINQHGR